MSLVILESLEARRLFSGDLVADQAAYDTANDKLSSDKTTQYAILDADKAKLTTDKATLQKIVDPLIKQQQDDLAAKVKDLQDAKSSFLTAKTTLQAVIKGDSAQLKTDKANAEALVKDKAKLLTDKASLKTLVTNYSKSLITSSSNWLNIVKDDKSAITNAKLTDEKTNADRLQLAKDSAVAAKILAVDAKNLAKAKYQLYKDALLGGLF